MEYRELMDTMKALCAASNDLWEAENCLQDADSDHAAARDKWLRSINKLDECRDALIGRKREVRRQPDLRVVASNSHAPFTVLHGEGDVINSNDPDPFNTAMREALNPRPFDGPDAA